METDIIFLEIGNVLFLPSNMPAMKTLHIYLRLNQTHIITSLTLSFGLQFSLVLFFFSC